MAVRSIVRLGHPVLRSAAAAVAPSTLASTEVQTLIDDMIDTMREADGVGLAAPQVAVPLQLFVYEVDADDPADRVALRVIVNPMLEPLHGELVEDWEGCLSIPDLRGLVPRHPAVRVRGLGRDGAAFDYVAQGFEARIVQHEYDHLNGVVYLDRMRTLVSLGYSEEWDEVVGDAVPQEEGAAVG